MHTAFLIITWGTASTVHQKPITELVGCGCAYIVQLHMVSTASPLLDDMHERLTAQYTHALASFRAAQDLVMLHLHLTAALPAMSSCIHIGPHCLTLLHPRTTQ